MLEVVVIAAMVVEVIPMINSFKFLLKNQRGSVAILLVLSAVAIVTPFVVNFSYDVELSELKVYNIENRSQAKLTAESGLQFAMARLRLYKEAFNFLEKNKSAQGLVKPELLDTLWNFPFVYPIPITSKMNIIQKDAIKKFQIETLLVGSMNLTIQNISNKINLNLLRISEINKEIKESQKKIDERNQQPADGDEEFNPETQLTKILQNAIFQKSENDEFFQAQYAGIEIGTLVNELTYFISDPNSIDDAGGGDENFRTPELSAKKAPIASYSELYMLPAWPDDITNLIRSEFTIHGALMIDLNKITDQLLKVLIPDILPEDIEEFFKYKNNPKDPKHFNSLDEFKNYIVSIGNIMNSDDFDERFKKFQEQGLQFGPTPTLFQVIVSSTVNSATYTLTAYVSIPAVPKPRIPEPQLDENGNPIPPENVEGEEGEEGEEGNERSGNGGTPPAEQPTQLLEPRIVEIIIS